MAEPKSAWLRNLDTTISVGYLPLLCILSGITKLGHTDVVQHYPAGAPLYRPRIAP